MKRTVLLFAVIVFLFSACTGTVRKQAPLDKVQGHYSLTAAKTDGCVVFEDLHITSGKPVWDTFFNAANLGKTASVRLAYYYTLGDPSHYTPELYAEIKDDYPKLFLRDLNYIDGKYTVTDYEEGRFITKEDTGILSSSPGSRKTPTPRFRSIRASPWSMTTRSPGMN